MVYADLHVHTDNSDGTLTFSGVPEAASRAGVDVVAVTDHDRYHPGFDAPVLERDGVVLIHGIELRVEAPGQRVDLLGYGIIPTEPLEAEVKRLQADRIERGRAIVECIEAELGVSLDVEIQKGLGRPDIARAVTAHPESGYDGVQGVFDDLIGEDEPCFVAREVPSFDRGLELLRDASAFVGLAHPFRYPDPAAALGLCVDLDAVERYYPYDRPAGENGHADESRLTAAMETHDLLATGGSDAHGTDLGKAGVSAADYERIETRLPSVS